MLLYKQISNFDISDIAATSMNYDKESISPYLFFLICLHKHETFHQILRYSYLL